jgi:histidinol dehydrogenase
MDVKNEGDRSLIHYTRKFDQVDIERSALKVSNSAVQDAYEKLRVIELRAFKKATENILRFHRKQIESDWFFETLDGVVVGQTMRPLSAVGCYAPGGRAAYPSSVLMCILPTKVAGVERCVVCSPPQANGEIHPAILVAADMAGATEIYRVGGAQAIAALAYGTETIKPVDKIVGPGNAYVTAAKQHVSQDVAIDLPAGPSEILIIADETAEPPVIAADLLAQAEHDPEALTILLATSEEIVLEVQGELQKQLEILRRKEIAQQSIKTKNYLVIVKDLEEAIDFTNKIAPEHLEILTKTPRTILNKIQNSGAIFLGRYSPIAFGDYSAGTNHVLPTNGFARIFSGLSVRDFVKKISVLDCNRKGYFNLKDLGVTLAKLEGFEGHAASIDVRVNVESTRS